MPDQRPSRLAGDERATLRLLLQYHRDSVVRKLHGIDDQAARHSPVKSGTSLLWLVKHLTSAETTWFVNRFDGGTGPVDDRLGRGDTIISVVEGYRAAWDRSAPIIDGNDLDALCRGLPADDPPTNLRWVLTHMVEETARHAGHADILRELLDGATGR